MAGTRNPRTPDTRKNLPAIPTDAEKDFNAGRGNRKEREDMYIGGGDGYNRDAESSQPGLGAEGSWMLNKQGGRKDKSSPSGMGIPPPPAKDNNYATSTPTTRYTPQSRLTGTPTTKHKAPRNKMFTLPRFTLKRAKPAPSSTRSDSTTNTLPKLPDFVRTSPIAQQLPSNFFPRDFTMDDDQSSDAQTTPDLTMDDLYHLVLNMQKGFQVQIEEMSNQIRELKKEVKRLRGEETEEEDEEEEEDDLEELMLRRSHAGTAASVRSATREMDKYADTGRWFHNE
ncbi:9706_t:CDS:2 [Paraglomus occultum]|uniref:9706_t:CDS:1 n=1 Tax=Paraglomus occultum TaxID=144539 RepID=A0A9N8W8V1_9GLOM|nr:9706_t:CDS:2 [Paraglomus occultum]